MTYEELIKMDTLDMVRWILDRMPKNASMRIGNLDVINSDTVQRWSIPFAQWDMENVRQHAIAIIAGQEEIEIPEKSE